MLRNVERLGACKPIVATGVALASDLQERGRGVDANASGSQHPAKASLATTDVECIAKSQAPAARLGENELAAEVAVLAHVGDPRRRRLVPSR